MKLARIGALALGILASLLLGEATVRIAGLGHTTLSKGRLHTHDADAGWICNPGVEARFAKPGSFDVGIKINSRGIRGPEHAAAKPPGTRRVVVLGDSGVWGHGVEDDETLASVVERLSPDTEVINLGVNGYSSVQELVRFETEGVRYAPDWTVLVFSLNDLEDNFDDKDGGRPVVDLREDGAVEIANRPVRTPWKSTTKQWFRHHSQLFNFAEYGSEILKARRKQRRAQESRRVGRSPRVEQMVFTLVDHYAPPVPAVDRAWAAFRGLLVRIAALAGRDGGRLLVVYTTGQQEAQPELLPRLLDDGQPGIDPLRPARRLSALCDALDLPYLDPLAEFRAHPDPESLFLKADPHWSAAGLELVGKLVAQRLEWLDAR